MKVKNPAGYFKMWMNVLAKDDDLSGDDKFVGYHAAALAVFDEQPHATLNDESFCRDVGLAIEDVEGAIDKLVALGYVAREGYKTRSGGIKLKFVIPSHRVKRKDGEGSR